MSLSLDSRRPLFAHSRHERHRALWRFKSISQKHKNPEHANGSYLNVYQTTPLINHWLKFVVGRSVGDTQAG